MRGIALGRDAAASPRVDRWIALLSSVCDVAAGETRSSAGTSRVVPSSVTSADPGVNAGHADAAAILGGMATKDELVRLIQSRRSAFGSHHQKQ